MVTTSIAMYIKIYKQEISDSQTAVNKKTLPSRVSANRTVWTREQLTIYFKERNFFVTD